jgi:RNA polymerase sigma factor (sigma-70 family)
MNWQEMFLKTMPALERCLHFAFRRLPPNQKEELVQSALANACVACERLVSQGRPERVFATALARYAVAQVREGRSVGTVLNVRDVTSEYAQRKKRLIRRSTKSFEELWLESIREDHQTPVADQAAFRIDFPEWLVSLPLREKEIAQSLAAGYCTNDVAKKFAISPGRVSQLRRELLHSWRQFHGYAPTPTS